MGALTENPTKQIWKRVEGRNLVWVIGKGVDSCNKMERCISDGDRCVSRGGEGNSKYGPNQKYDHEGRKT